MLRPRRLLRPSVPLHRGLVLRRLPPTLLSRRLQSTSSISSATAIDSDEEGKRQSASFFISNVLPIKLAYWDFRPAIARLREDALMEQLSDIGSEITGHGFRIESWEISRKDGGVFMHFSYVPPSEVSVDSSTNRDSKAGAEQEAEAEAEAAKANKELLAINALPERSYARPSSPGRLFLPQLVDSAKKHGGFPSWLGQAWANWTNGQTGDVGRVPGHELYATRSAAVATESNILDGAVVKGSGSGMRGIQAMAGDGRVWLVKGRQWTEDMNRFPSNRLRVEFDGPDVSQEMLYTLFRPYGRVADITPPAPVPSGSLRFATVSFSRLSPAATAINTLHGYSTPTNTADFTLRATGQPSDDKITLSRLRLYYERPLKAHAIRDWLSSHPRLVLPALAFLIGTLSYTFFDPVRAFFVRSKLEGVWDIENYSLVKAIRQRITLPKSFSLFSSSTSTSDDSAADTDTVGQNAWRDRIEAEKSVERWLTEYPSTFITITGPPGSGKQSLLSRVLKREEKPALVIDCSEIGKAKNDAGLVSALAEQTGYYPVFSFLSSINGMIDLASVGLIGQKAGFSTPVDQQLRQILEIVGGALKDTSNHVREGHKQVRKDKEDEERMNEERRRRLDLIRRGAWHDGRLDCVAGNGIMSELGLGEEPTLEGDLLALPASSPPPLMDDVAPIDGEAVPPTFESLASITPSASTETKKQQAKDAEVDDETEFIRTLPIVVLQNYAQKAGKGDVWNVLAEWGTSLVENRIAHVIVVTDNSTATKSLTRALPSKPLNSVSLADADEANSLSYVKDKLKSGTRQQALSADDSAQVSKLGGRMVDLETLVYKVRTGTKVKDAVDDIVLKNVVELRKAAFGDDTEDAKSLPWTRAQAWKVVSELAKDGEISYSQLLQDFPFKGAEHSLKALEEHELVGVTYVDGRASRVKPGKPVYRYAFQSLVDDPVFRAFYQIEYNTALIASADGSIKSCETELSTLKDITADGGDDKLGVNGSSWLGMGKHSAIRDRARWLLDKMGKNVDKLAKLEKENEEMMKVLSSTRA